MTRSTLILMVLAALAAPAGPARAQAPFTVAGVVAQPGTIVSGEVQVPARGTDPGTVIPFSILNGSKPGPVLGSADCRKASAMIPASAEIIPLKVITPTR